MSFLHPKIITAYLNDGNEIDDIDDNITQYAIENIDLILNVLKSQQ